MDSTVQQCIVYEADSWNSLSEAIEKILQNKPIGWVSFEQMYAIVYKCVCSGSAEKMHGDLLELCSKHLDEVEQTLREKKTAHFQNHDDDSVSFVLSFRDALELYLNAVPQITPIFGFMNKFFVEMRLQTTLQNELLDLFRVRVANKHIDTLMNSVRDLLSRPFAVDPSVLLGLFVRLHSLGHGDYALAYPDLFARYIPCVLPPMQESDLERHVTETKVMQDQMRIVQLSESATTMRGSKRRGDDESYGPSAGVGATAVQAGTPQLYN
ncbi:CDK2-associated and cullin domain-containing protein 1-like [Schistocerca americana]|uniref:CDK2-associated and cullin domain-containing protein 1-like n=1 Tax=Schistocerca americana TaxID=7009 RepID=UPI001F5027E1|nr:CDK2-associated and cullin domain-containing protein 1-like [Schistocerca americana]XP_047113517.1 CDK2-associated and cullin domain-containing protein 1-like [Schistocerca piceifrons]XP_049811074.1 CDK2-associated and cullin domain-containing protein 1-like [Schistocerca nitens]XP_049957436.1 CDK2-associated and cullin domain-containing protein 1-like [Schistocerca serialis cubense]